MKTTWIGKGLKGLVPGSPNLNVINILRSLFEDKGTICYIPFSYVQENKSTTDPRIHFLPIETGKSIEIKSITSNKERFNFSVTGALDVYVEYPNEETGEVTLVPKKVFRTYTVIRDGELAMDYIIAKLSENAFNELRHAGVLYYNGSVVPDNHQYISDFLYKINLQNIPLLSLAWAQPAQIKLYENLDKENKLSNTLSLVNSMIKEYKEAGQVLPAESEDSIYYTEKSSSSKIEPKKLCPCVVYEVENDGEIVDSFASQITDLISATKVKKAINAELINIRFINRCIIYAIELSKNKGNYDWSELAKVPRSKNKLFQTTEVPGLGRMYNLKRTIYEKEF